jgi:uncharacterized protein (TIGR04255 family)
MTVKYKNPPINELIIGAYFDQPIAPLRSEHVGLFWAEIRKEFPKIQQQPELSLPLVGPTLTFQIGLGDEPYPMPRFWLISEDDTVLMQIQKNAFIFNWRRRNTEYPHFDAVKSSFDQYFGLFSSFLKKELGIESLNIQVAELTYSNLIESGDYWAGPGDTPKLIPTMSIPDPGIPIERNLDFNYLTAYKLASGLALHVSVRTGRKASEADKAILIFELRALGALGAANKLESDAWFKQAHDAIGYCFTAMTNPVIQREYWQPA